MYEPRWVFPRTLEEACDVLREAAGRARAVAGGTDLVPLVRSGALRPEILVDIGRVEDASAIDRDDGEFRIGALATHGSVAGDDRVWREAAVLAEACSSVGSPQIRSRGTVGGNLANASPAADGAVALLALDASACVCTGRGGGDERIVPLSEFFQGPGETVLSPGELVQEVRFERLSRDARSLYLKVGQRNALAIAIVSVATVFEPGRGSVRIAIGSAAPTPTRARDAEGLFESEWPTAADREILIDEVARVATGAVRPIDDVRATARYRTVLVEALVRRALHRLCL